MPDKLGQRINDQLQQQKLSISEVASSLGVSRQALYKWINKNQISDSNLIKLAALFGVTPAWLKYGHDGQTHEEPVACDCHFDIIERQDRFDFILKATNALSMEWGLDHGDWQWRGSAKEVLGVSADQLPSSKPQFLALLGDNDKQRFEACWQNVLSNQGGEELDVALLFPEVCCRVSVSLRMSARRSRIQMVLHCMEMLSQYQYQLKHYEQQAKQIKALCNVAYWEWDVLRDRFTGCSKILVELGHRPTKAETNRDGILRYLHPDDRAAFNAALDRAQRTKSGIDLNIRLLEAGGDHQLFHCMADVELDSNGRVVALAGVSKNITERSCLNLQNKLLEQRCAELQSRTSNEGSMIVDSEGYIVDACRGVALQLGYGGRQELVGKHVYQLFDMHTYTDHLSRFSSGVQPLSFKSHLYDKNHQRQECKVRVYDASCYEADNKLMVLLLEDIGVR